MKKIRSLICFVLVAALCASLCGCDKPTDAKKEKETEEEYFLDLEIGKHGKTFSARYHTIALLENGRVVAVGRNEDGECNVSSWEDIVAVDNDGGISVGLKSNGTVVAVGINDNNQLDVGKWCGIVAIAAESNHIYGVKEDGTVVMSGDDNEYNIDVSAWTDIVEISAAEGIVVGLKSDGTVVASGNNDYGQCNVAAWTDVVEISLHQGIVVGLKSDGTIVFSDYVYLNSELDPEETFVPTDWQGIACVVPYETFLFAINADGELITNSCNMEAEENQDEEYVQEYHALDGAIALSASWDHVVGLMPDGTLVAVGYNDDGRCNVSGWTNVMIPQ